MIPQRALLLVVDDDEPSRDELVRLAEAQGHLVDGVADADAALESIERTAPHLVVMGLALSEAEGLDFLQRAKRVAPDCAYVALARGESPDTMIDAIRQGADHCLRMPVKAETLAVVIRRALEKPALAAAMEVARQRMTVRLDHGHFERIVGAHPVMQQLLDKALQAAQSRATVLIRGETGTGKELVAAAIHENSKRVKGPFVRLNCSALAETVLESELFGHERGAFTGAVARRRGRFEQADGGTLFLDEVSEIPPTVQVKLLRFLQEREFERVGGEETLRVDVRIVAATNVELKPLVEDRKFREDLYYRLNVVRLEIPPLRARPSDVPPLADHFLRKYADENEKDVTSFSDEAMQALLAHPWPGNVRELQNVVEQAVVLCRGEVIHLEDLPIAPVQPEEDPIRLLVPGVTMAELERYAIVKTLEAVGWSPTKAAEILGISRRTVQYRMRQWGYSGRAKGKAETSGPNGDREDDDVVSSSGPGQAEESLDQAASED